MPLYYVYLNHKELLKREIREVKNESVSVYLRCLTAEREIGHSLWKMARKKAITQTVTIKNDAGKWTKK